MTGVNQEDYSLAFEECGEYMERIRINHDKMSQAELLVSDYLLAHPDEFASQSIHHLAGEIGASVATIIRFCKTIGYKGFADLKFHIQQGRVVLPEHDIGIDDTDSINTFKQKAIRFTQKSIEECILNTNNASFAAAINALSTANHILFTAIGSASGIAQAGAGMFLSLGMMAMSVGDTLLQLRTVACLKEGDVVIGISYNGTSKSTGDCLYYAKECGATTILITSAQDSILSKYADIVLFTAIRNISNTLNISTTAMCQLAVLQTLQIGVWQQNRQQLLERSRKQLHLTNLKNYSNSQSDIHVANVVLKNK
ncbi:MurR/RpiR family transcriptional regulator [Oscillibacter sp.]|uniref:MurR/RpiR family transcriptional regulator n=1 Tax=Oscillibacter sp. TaxID=1945593 RepID=UPI00289B6164|nr:MurR/RpiR family transcriptional regulator [Oscillibacter sp.]